MKINVNCLIELLNKNSFNESYVDNHQAAGKVIYFFGNAKPQLIFTSSCIDIVVVESYLEPFNLISKLSEIINDKCECHD